MTWDHLVTLLRRLFSPMPGAQITILRVVVVLLALALIATWRGWLRGLRGWLWAALGLIVGGIIIATLAFRIGDRVPPGTGREVLLDPFHGFRHAAGPHADALRVRELLREHRALCAAWDGPCVAVVWLAHRPSGARLGDRGDAVGLHRADAIDDGQGGRHQRHHPE